MVSGLCCKVVLVSSGAVGMGCRELGLAKKPTDPQMKRAVAGVGQSRIMRMYSELFETVGLKIAQLLVSQRDFMEQQRWAEIRDTIAACLDAGVVPIINEHLGWERMLSCQGLHKVTKGFARFCSQNSPQPLILRKPMHPRNDTTNTDGVRFGDNDNLAALTATWLVLWEKTFLPRRIPAKRSKPVPNVHIILGRRQLP